MAPATKAKQQGKKAVPAKKAAAKKAVASKKAAGPAKKAAASKKAAENGISEARAARQARDAELLPEILRLRDEEEQSWADISEAVGVGLGKTMLLYMQGSVAPKDRITWKDEDDLALKIVAARKAELSWGQIMVRAGITEAKARKLFQDASGTSHVGHRIGKGGRYPAGQKPAAPAKKAAKATKATKATGATKKAGMVKNLADMTADELNTRLAGKTITIGRGSKAARISVKQVSSLKKGFMVYTDAKGEERTVKVTDITKASQ